METNFLDSKAVISNLWNKESYFFSQQNALSMQLPTISKLISTFSGRYENSIWRPGTYANINASKINLDNSHQQFMSIDLDAAQKLFIDGFSLCFGDLSGIVDDTAPLIKQAIETFDYPNLIAVTAYLSPPKAIGVLHFDRQHNFFIQREGTKRWFVSEKAATQNPYANLVYSGLDQDFFDEMSEKGYHILLPNECGRKVYELNPGDVLYIPPGFYHSPETLDNPSLHYTLTIEPACFWEDFNKLLFSKMLSSTGKFNLDYRFLDRSDRDRLVDDCMQHILKNKVF